MHSHSDIQRVDHEYRRDDIRFIRNLRWNPSVSRKRCRCAIGWMIIKCRLTINRLIYMPTRSSVGLGDVDNVLIGMRTSLSFPWPKVKHRNIRISVCSNTLFLPKYPRFWSLCQYYRYCNFHAMYRAIMHYYDESYTVFIYYAALSGGPHFVLHPDRLSVRSVPCLRFSWNRKAVQTSNLRET